MSSSRGGASSSASSNSRSASPGPQHSSSTSTTATSSPPSSSNLSRTQSTAAYLSYPVTHVVSGLYRRLTEPSPGGGASKKQQQQEQQDQLRYTATRPEVYTPKRTASPFQPPPLTPLTLKGVTQNQLLTRTLAEEIRLLVPPRLQLVDTWRLAYSLDRDGSSLATLYENCRQYSQRSQRAGYVLVVRDSSSSGGGGTIFGAYLTDAPHPAPHYYGTGECFLWRASVLPSTPIVPASFDQKFPMTEEMLEQAGLPLPPSADTTHAGRSTTLRGEKKNHNNSKNGNLLTPPGEAATANGNGGLDRSGASTPDRIRFKAFPYSGVNDYMIFCETGFLSVGGG